MTDQQLSEEVLQSSAADAASITPVLAVVGPTATGKSDFALACARYAVESKRFAQAVLVSLDSRQIYRGLEVCTGADVPVEWSRVEEYFAHPVLPIKLFGVSCVQPDEEWSVAHLRQRVLPHIADEVKHTTAGQRSLVILVGGTGLYHEHLFSQEVAIAVGPNEALRERAAHLSLSELQEWVERDAPPAWAALNSSDRQNPRRLIRTLERQQHLTRVQADSTNIDNVLPFSLASLSHTTVGLTDELSVLKEKIGARVQQRLSFGAIDEVSRLIVRYDDTLWKLPAFTATGCREVRQYIEERLSYEELIELWTRREMQYVKRQNTWWKSHQHATTLEGFAQKSVQWHHCTKMLSEHGAHWQTVVIESCILGL